MLCLLYSIRFKRDYYGGGGTGAGGAAGGTEEDLLSLITASGLMGLPALLLSSLDLSGGCTCCCWTFFGDSYFGFCGDFSAGGRVCCFGFYLDSSSLGYCLGFSGGLCFLCSTGSLISSDI